MIKKPDITNSLALRLRGWRAALRSKQTPKWLRPSIRANIRRLSNRVKRKKERKLSSFFGG